MSGVGLDYLPGTNLVEASNNVESVMNIQRIRGFVRTCRISIMDIRRLIPRTRPTCLRLKPSGIAGQLRSRHSLDREFRECCASQQVDWCFARNVFQGILPLPVTETVKRISRGRSRLLYELTLSGSVICRVHSLKRFGNFSCNNTEIFEEP